MKPDGKPEAYGTLKLKNSLNILLVKKSASKEQRFYFLKLF